jgi:hypothetical protein
VKTSSAAVCSKLFRIAECRKNRFLDITLSFFVRSTRSRLFFDRRGDARPVTRPPRLRSLKVWRSSLTSEAIDSVLVHLYLLARRGWELAGISSFRPTCRRPRTGKLIPRVLHGLPDVLPPTGSRSDHAHFRYGSAPEVPSDDISTRSRCRCGVVVPPEAGPPWYDLKSSTSRSWDFRFRLQGGLKIGRRNFHHTFRRDPRAKLRYGHSKLVGRPRGHLLARLPSI